MDKVKIVKEFYTKMLHMNEKLLSFSEHLMYIGRKSK